MRVSDVYTRASDERRCAHVADRNACGVLRASMSVIEHDVKDFDDASVEM